jgi:hypothetical protein
MPDETRSAARFEGAVFGLIMTLGVALLLDRAGVVSLVRYSTIWPLLVIAFGLVKLSHRQDDGRREGGWWVFFGVWMLLNAMEVLRFRDSWPLILVAIGLSMAWKELAGRRGTPDPKGPGLLERERVE